MTLLAQQTAGQSLMPEASNFAPHVDHTFAFIFYVSAFFFVLIIGLMFVFLVKYRQRRPGEGPQSNISHNTRLEIVWTVIPTILLVPMFWQGFVTYMDTRVPPENTLDINVEAQKWSWNFRYPNGIEFDELHVPVDQPVRLIMASKDVIHSCYIPAFRVKRDVVPGRYTMMWFQATRPGTYPLYCAEYCGTSHSDMRTVVVVHEPGGYEKWLETANPLKALSDELFAEYQKDPQAFIEKYKNDPEWGKVVSKLQPPAMIGAELYKRKGCGQCHSVDGSANTGPTWKGLYGTKRVFTDGSSAVADENYLRESILDPGKHVVKGFDPVMPRTSISDREIDMIIAYIKSLKD